MNTTLHNSSFETLYTQLRRKEGRLYSDEQVKRLPQVGPRHSHYREWQLRKLSAVRLANYLKKKNSPLTILEIGCGNGWLSAQLAHLPRANVTGIDINGIELRQAQRVFGDNPSLSFHLTALEDLGELTQHFDILVFAASIQYFPSVEKVITRSLALLKPGGEIHIMDSFFYTPQEGQRAERRSRLYHEQAGFKDLADYYFCHRLDNLNSFQPVFLSLPGRGWLSRFQKRGIFPWIRINATPPSL